MIVANILLGIAFAYLTLGICAEDDCALRRDLVHAMGCVTALIIVLNIFA